MEILVTGYKGKIGSQLVKDGAIPLKCDVTRPESIRKALTPYQGTDYAVINCAVKQDVPWLQQKENFKEGYNVNVHGIRNLMEEVSPTARVIHLSSCHVYNGNKFWNYTESHKPDPVNMYGMTKYASEVMCGLFPEKQVRVIRIGKAYNDNDLEEIPLLENRIVPKFIKRNWCHVDDISKILGFLTIAWDETLKYYHNILNKYYPIMNIGNPEQNYSYLDFYNLVADKENVIPFVGRGPDYSGKYSPRPFSVKFSLRRMQKAIPYKGFRSL